MIEESSVNIMKYKFLILSLLICIFDVNAFELPEYEAKYNFESEEISITGIRKFKKNQNDYEISFNGSNLLASLSFTSKFNNNNNIVLPKTYDIKIRPKFLKRDQSVVFNQKKGFIDSIGHSSWEVSYSESSKIFDPLNVQIMIRMFIKEGLDEFDLAIVDMERGRPKNYTYRLKENEKCIVASKEYNCFILERSRKDSDRVVKYYLAEELEYMFVKIIDSSPKKTNKLELIEILSFG